ncbi:MAG TPA: carboxypeptidase-like regulatory domain-containing protein, partial [Archangium sp.]
LAAGTRRIVFTKPGYHDPNPNRTLTLAAGEKATLPQVKLLLDRGDLAGRVRMSDGSQLDSVSVFIAGVADAGTGAYSAQAVRSAADPTVGDFVLRDIPIGTYNVVARRTNYVDATSPSIDVRPGQVVRLTDDLRLARLQGDFLIEDDDSSNTPGFTRARSVTLVLSNVTNAAEFRVVEGSQQALAAAPWQPYATNRIAFTLTAGDGSKAVYLQIKNTMGNEGAALTANITLDTTPPSNTSLVLGTGSGFTRISNPVPVTLGATDQGGVALVRLAAAELDGGYAVSDAGVPDGGFPQLVAASRPYVRDTSFDRPVLTDGVQPVVAQFIDNAGNASQPLVASIVVDTLPPTGTVTVVRGARATIDGYTNSLLVDLAESWGTEPNGGFVQVRLANDVVDLGNAVAQPTRPRASWFLDAQGEGTKTVHYVFIDAAGNQSGAAQASIIYDATNPQLSATLTSPTPTSNPTITIGLSVVESSPFVPDAGAPDGGPIVAALLLAESALFTNAVGQGWPSNSSTSFTLSSGDGARTVYLRARDAAGNEGNASVSLELDTTPPANVAIGLVGSLSDGTPSSTLTASSTVTVNLTHSGATQVLLGDSSLTTCPTVGATWRAITGNSIANHPLPGSGSPRTVNVCFADAAGNATGPATASIAYDGAAPTGCQLTLSGLRTDGTAAGSTRTALRSIPFSLTNCTETPLEVALTEQSSVSCAATAAG